MTDTVYYQRLAQHRFNELYAPFRAALRARAIPYLKSWSNLLVKTPLGNYQIHVSKGLNGVCYYELLAKRNRSAEGRHLFKSDSTKTDGLEMVSLIADVLEKHPMESYMKKKTDAELKKELVALAKSGAPRPKSNTVLGKALKRFTTKPTE